MEWTKTKTATHRPAYPRQFWLLALQEPKAPLWRRVLRAAMRAIK